MKPEKVQDKVVQRTMRSLRHWVRMTVPVARGLDNIPAAGSGPVLFVGNHSIFGFADSAAMMYLVHQHSGRFLRFLGDHVHFTIPLWGRWLRQYGVVDGTRENMACLAEMGASIAVFPGGAREVSTRKGEAYKLVWGQRVGFVREAIRAGIPIIPFAAVGAEESWKIHWDADEIQASPIGTLLRKAGLRDDVILPVATGLGGTILPKPQRLYFSFAPAVETLPYQDRIGDRDLLWELREQIATTIRQDLDDLLAYRETDLKRHLRYRLLDLARGPSVEILPDARHRIR